MTIKELHDAIENYSNGSYPKDFFNLQIADDQITLRYLAGNEYRLLMSVSVNVWQNYTDDLFISYKNLAKWPISWVTVNWLMNQYMKYIQTPEDKRGQAQRYLIRVIKGSKYGYLSEIETPERTFIQLSTKEEGLFAGSSKETTFTLDEVDRFKRDKRLAIDWDRAEIKKAPKGKGD